MKRQAMIGSRRPERRAEIVSAAGRIIEQKGLEGASLRAIARELGCTTGVLTHHFVNKEDLLQAALDALFRPFDQRMATANKEADRLEGIRNLLLFILPISTTTQAAARLWLRIVLRAVVDQSLAFDYRQRYGALRLGFTELLEEGQKTGEFCQDFDPAMEADILFALVDGLIIHTLAEPDWFPSERLVTLVDHQLKRLTHPQGKARRRTQQGTVKLLGKGERGRLGALPRSEIMSNSVGTTRGRTHQASRKNGRNPQWVEDDPSSEGQQPNGSGKA